MHFYDFKSVELFWNRNISSALETVKKYKIILKNEKANLFLKLYPKGN